jgi:hypothetical protein
MHRILHSLRIWLHSFRSLRPATLVALLDGAEGGT